METTLGILAFMVAVLAVLQGWQMLSQKRNRSNNPGIGDKLDVIINKLGKMEMRLNDIWDKIKER